MSSVCMRKVRAVKGSGRGLFHSLAFFPAAMLAMGAVSADASELPDPTGEILLTVTGNVGQTNDGDRALFDREMLETLPAQTLETHTVVTDGVKTFDGFLVRDLLARVEAEGETVTASALNDYVIEIPMEDFHDFDVVAATHMDGERLSPRDKGPLWIVYPRDDHGALQDIRYDYRWVWQLIQLDIE